MAEQRTDFSDLVRERRAELGISLRELENRAADPETGERAKFGWISKVEKGSSVDTPSPGLLRALAAGLQLPLRILQEAAGVQFLGMDPSLWSEDRTTRVLVARAEELTQEDRRQLLDIAETFARRRTQSDGHAGD